MFPSHIIKQQYPKGVGCGSCIIGFDEKKDRLAHPAEENQEVFVHFTAIEEEGFKTLDPGDEVEFVIGRRHS